jgi:hypothetical protein
MFRCVVLHVVTNIRPNAQGSLKSWMPGSNCETWRRICEIYWYSAGHITTLSGWITAGECLDISGSQVHPMVQMSFPNNNAVFKMTVRLCTHKRSVSVWGPWRSTSTSSLASTIARLKYHQTTVASCRQHTDKHSPSSITPPATRRCSSWTVVQYSTGDCSELVSVYCRKDTSYITGK